MSCRRSTILLTGLMIGVFLGAAPSTGAQLAQEILAPSELRLDTQASWERAAVQVKGPQGLRFRKDFAAGDSIAVSLASRGGGLPADGRYTYMLRVEPAVGPGIQTGMFFVENGQLVSRAAKRAELKEVRQDLNEERQARMTPAPGITEPPPGAIFDSDLLYLEDASNDGLTHVQLDSDDAMGLDYADSFFRNNFGMTELCTDADTPYIYCPLRIDDLANVNSLYLGYDFLLTFNDSTVLGDFAAGNGFFAPPLFFVDDYNDFVGINTASPANILHVYNGSLRVERGDGVTPNIRFSSIDAAQRWLFQLNSSSGVFAVRDETGGASPFRIKPGAPENGLSIEASGRLNTSTGAFLSSSGVWTNNSSRDQKEEIQDLSVEEAMAVLAELDPVKFKYRGVDERYVGFIAEDVPELVATAERKGLAAMDIVAVLTRVVQEQQEALAAKDETAMLLQNEVAMLNRRLEQLEALIQNQDVP